MTLTLDDLPNRIPVVATKTAQRFARFVDREDVEQELRAYVLGEGKRHIEQWVEDGEEFRVMRALYGAARQFCEREKAAKSGYSFEDVAWYSPAKLADLMPLALNGSWDGLSGEGDETAGFGSTDGREGGTLLAMVADIRRAVKQAGLPDHCSAYSPDSENGVSNLERLADALGGEWPDAPGYGRGRRSISNASARAITESGYAA